MTYNYLIRFCKHLKISIKNFQNLYFILILFFSVTGCSKLVEQNGVPVNNEIRANLHIGGKAKRTTLTKREIAISKAFEESKAAEELTLDQYNKGLSTIFELLNAQSRRLNSESLLINAKRLRLTNRIKMYMAIATPVYGKIK